MCRQISTTIMAFAILIQVISAKEIAGIQMPDSRSIGNVELVLNGAGIRAKAFFNIYAGGLYLRQKIQDSQYIIDANETMLVRLHMVSRLVTSKKMIAATRDGFKRSTKGNTAAIQKRIDQFIAVFKQGVKRDDVYEIVYTSVKGTVIYRNGERQTTIKGLDFKQALFGIWLSDDPVHEGLKKGMLGK